MFDKIEYLFRDMGGMIRCPKKNIYEQKMNYFLEDRKWFLEEVTEWMEQSECKGDSAKELSRQFTQQVFDAFSRKNRIKPYVQADLNMFMIYYVFPAILKTEKPYARLLADEICREWRERFQDSNIRYTSYEELYNNINEKILGIF